MDLGLTTQQERVYRYLAEHGRTPAAHLRDLLGNDDVDEAVDALRDRGLLIGDPPDARHPGQVFQRLIRDREAALFNLKAQIAELQELFDSADRPPSRGPVLLLTSRGQAMKYMDELELNATDSLDKFITAPYARLVQVHAPHDKARLDPSGTLRQPRRRVLYEQAVVDDDNALDGIRNTLRLPNAEIRIATRLPYKLILSDCVEDESGVRGKAMVPAYERVHSDRSSTHLITGGAELLAHMRVFEQCWEAATPFSADAGRFREDFSEEDRQVLQLLVGGSTNESIARLLDVSVRTVGRRLIELRERAGVDSRAALIRHAATKWMI